jgi:hypothetical protein
VLAADHLALGECTDAAGQDADPQDFVRRSFWNTDVGGNAWKLPPIGPRQDSRTTHAQGFAVIPAVKDDPSVSCRRARWWGAERPGPAVPRGSKSGHRPQQRRKREENHRWHEMARTDTGGNPPSVTGRDRYIAGPTPQRQTNVVNPRR